MKSLAHDMAFPALRSNIEQWKEQIIENGQFPNVLMESHESCDVTLWYVLYLLNEGLFQEAEQFISKIDKVAYEKELGGAWLHLADMTAKREQNRFNEALLAGECALKSLVDIEKDYESIDYQAVVVAVVYGLAMIHYRVGESLKAEKELIKAQKILEKLAKKDKLRFGTSIVIAIEASTTVFNSRLKQMNVLVHYQVATDLYLDKANKGITQAINDLVDSLQKEGDLHLKIGNYRDAVRYYTKAIRYQKKVTTKMGDRELRLSMNLGRALLQIKNRQATGEQLLRSLLSLADRLGMAGEKNEIQALLDHKGKSFDFLAYIKKWF